MAWDMGFKFITLETDFTLVNNLLITTQYIPLLVYMYVLVVFDYRKLMEKQWEI